MDVNIPLTCFGTASCLGAMPYGLSPGQVFLILLIVLASGSMLLATRRRVRRGGPSPKAYAREQIARIRDEQTVVGDMEEVMGQLEQLASRIQAGIDTRFAKLEAVIRDADRRIDKLERLLRRANGEPALDLIIDDSTEAPPPPPESELDGQRKKVHELADAGVGPAAIARETGQTVGEIELMLALRRTASAAGS